MRIGLKLTAAFLSIASLVGAAGYVAQLTNRAVEQQMEQLGRGAILKVADTTEITVALYASQLASHAILVAQRSGRDDAANRHGLIGANLQVAEAGLDRQRLAAESLTRWAAAQGLAEVVERETTQTLPTLARIAEEFAQHRQLQDEFLRLLSGSVEEAERFLNLRLCQHAETDVLPLLAEYRQRAEKELTGGIRTTERAMVVANQWRGLLLVAAAVCAVLMGLFTSRSIGAPLGILQRAAAEVGQGRFDVRVAIRRRDEIGMLAAQVNQMAADLKATTVSRAYLDNIICSMREMLIVVDPELTVRRVNPAACAELGQTEDQLAGRELPELFIADELPDSRQFLQALSLGLECSMKHASGAPIPVHCSAAEIRGAIGDPGGFVCVASNISRRRMAEVRLRASLEEKDLLRKEVHHRVKNNLQVISSLLSLLSREIGDPEIAQLFQESQGRIRSMALIHEQLYRSGDLARIDFTAYVEDLVGHLRRGLGRKAAPVTFQLEVQTLPLPLDLAVPCGMIVNELVTNALQHAFPDGRSGEIRVTFTQDAAGYRLAVADDGVGIKPDRCDARPPSLGLRVVEALTRQIDGSLTVRHNSGTRFEIRFQGRQWPRTTDQ
ncbi:MAG: histidine kinase dimerization/phosphoacceptor domain -containing protein [Pirellulales bacterium]|nr:histidine kinase dimerization/phosphoacceptor domain -containing protein [Pirellulales bacterium]